MVVRNLTTSYVIIVVLQNGFTPLHIAAKYNSVNAASLLINSDAKLDALTSVS